MNTATTLGIGIIMALFQLSDLGGITLAKRESASVITSAAMEVAMCKAQQRLESVIGIVRPGTCIHYATAGDWSTHDLVLHLAAQTGPAHVSFATWSISEPAVRQLIRALSDGRLLSLGILADWRVPTRCPEALQLARASATRCGLASVHAKVAVLHGGRFDLAIVTSGNLTTNPRIEAGVIAIDPAAAAFHRGWIDAELRGASTFDMAGRHPADCDDED